MDTWHEKGLYSSYTVLGTLSVEPTNVCHIFCPKNVLFIQSTNSLQSPQCQTLYYTLRIQV